MANFKEKLEELKVLVETNNAKIDELKAKNVGLRRSIKKLEGIETAINNMFEAE